MNKAQEMVFSPIMCVVFVSSGETKSIGNVMKRNAPFFKLYVEYVNKFGAATDLIDQLKKRSTKFSNFIENFQVSSINAVWWLPMRCD
jgi:hypothetical protein